MTTEQEKWAFCESKICFYCHKDISKELILDDVVTGCPLIDCHRSFCE